MLRLKAFQDLVIEDGDWHSYDLTMTSDGFTELDTKLTDSDRSCPQVYVHVGAQGTLKNRVIRIGKAESGIRNRWIKSKDGHFATLSWAIGHSDKYGSANAKDYPNYLLFFANLLNLDTKLHVLTFQNNMEGILLSRVCEKILISCFPPMWEDMLNRYISYFTSNSREETSKFGNALRIVNDPIKPFAFNIHKVLSNNGSVFTLHK